MNKLLKLSLVGYLLIGLNGCGVEEEDKSIKGLSSLISYYIKELPKYFQVHYQRLGTNGHHEYGLKSESNELIFKKTIEKNSQSLIKCQEYENEQTFVTYDCNITTDKNDNIEEKSFIITKGIKYNFYTKTSIDGNDSILFELFIPKNN